jgi:hypothetical protein
MSFTEWYIRHVLNKDPARQHRSIWNNAKKQISALSEGRVAKLRSDWREFNSKKEGVSTTPSSGREDYSTPIVPPGVEVPSSVRGMNELQDFLELSEAERKKLLKAKDSPIQLPLFSNPKISTLIKALKKVSG